MPLCYRLAILLLLTTLWSCQVESLDDPIIVPIVDQEFSFQLWQNLSSTGVSPLEIRMSTLENFECLNTTILSDYVRVDNRLELTLFDILDPEFCETGLAPAKGLAALDNVEANIYDLRIELQDVVSNLGSLTIDNEGYTVAMQDTNGISWLQDEMRRIPENALWGYLSYSDATSQAQAEDFVAELTALGAVSTLPDGYYGHYTLKDSGSTLDLNTANTPPQAVKFILEYNDSLSEIDQRVADFLADADEAAQLQIWDGKGNTWQD